MGSVSMRIFAGAAITSQDGFVEVTAVHRGIARSRLGADQVAN